jgi:purine-nucleoside phosphorylase
VNISRYLDRINRAASFLRDFFQHKPLWCAILGSGLGGLGETLNARTKTISYSEIPGFPKSSVQGHEGKLVFGYWQNVPIVVMEGRFHSYEGHDWQTLVVPVRALILAGVSHFFLTNAAGGIRHDLTPGDLMLIKDHLNLMNGNPLVGPNIDSFGPRFPAMTGCYDAQLIETVEKYSRRNDLNIKKGVYAALQGPCYETPAEIHMLKVLGADAVGMSTVPEVIAIQHAGCRAVGISLITNSTGLAHVPTHQEVMDMASLKKQRLHRLMLETFLSISVKDQEFINGTV